MNGVWITRGEGGGAAILGGDIEIEFKRGLMWYLVFREGEWG